MPLNTLRLNHQPSSHPNHLITFIKPLPRPPHSSHLHEHAETFLKTIAAQCLPIMKANHLSITTLEEHEPNREFIGRNFNNGEVIQLVLRSQDNTRWLPVNVVQMVMMHELAHNKQMNHSRKFWEVRNGFVQELRGLWARRFTGEGFWGGGRVLGDLEGRLKGGDGVVGSDEIKDLQVCGGTFRSRRMKRRRIGAGGAAQGQELTWREKRDRRIEKKFGKNGVSLGEDEDARLSLEIQGKGPVGVKPRVAKSKRGRELRAAAALARFETSRKETDNLGVMKKEEDRDDEVLSGSESEYEEVDIDADQEDAKDLDGQRMHDTKGNGLIKVCGDEDEDGVEIKQEMDDLEGLGYYYSTHGDRTTSEPSYQVSRDHTVQTEDEDRGIKAEYNTMSPLKESTLFDQKDLTGSEHHTSTTRTSSTNDKQNHQLHPYHDRIINDPLSLTRKSPTEPESKSKPNSQPPRPPSLLSSTPRAKECPICTLTNSPHDPTCQACSHVLNAHTDPRSWKCANTSCRETAPSYTNAGDVAVCGLCGTRNKKGDA